jgi:tetratricopeptide (TPR) repeat protein
VALVKLFQLDVTAVQAEMLSFAHAAGVSDLAPLYAGIAHRRFSEGEVGEALKMYAQAQDIDPENVEVYLGRAMLNQAIGQLVAARTDIGRALALAPDNPNAHTLRGIVLLQLDQPEQAFDDFNRAIALDPDQVAAHLNRGHALTEMGRPEEAIRDFDAALANDPHMWQALLGRGKARFVNGEYDNSIGDYESVLELAPNAEIEEDLQRARKARDMLADEVRCYEIRHSSPPDDLSLARLHAQISIQLHDAMGAIHHWSRAIDHDPEDATLYALRASMHAITKHDQAAVFDYTRALAATPDDGNLYFLRGFSLMQLGRYEEALADFDAATIHGHADAKVLAERGLVLELLKNHEDAVTSYNRALSLSADGSDVALIYYRRGLSLRELGQLDQARRDFGRAIRLDNSEPSYCVALAETLHEAGECKKTLAAYRTFIARHPRETRLYLGRSRLLMEEGDVEAALVDLDRAAELGEEQAAELAVILRNSVKS